MADGSCERACYISVNQIIISERFKVDIIKYVYAKVLCLEKMSDETWLLAVVFGHVPVILQRVLMVTAYHRSVCFCSGIMWW